MNGSYPNTFPQNPPYCVYTLNFFTQDVTFWGIQKIMLLLYSFLCELTEKQTEYVEYEVAGCIAKDGPIRSDYKYIQKSINQQVCYSIYE